MDRHIFSMFNGAYSYYNSALVSMRNLNPDVVIYSAERYETFILAAQAAKTLDIKNILVAHGLMGGGEYHNKKGRFKLFDYALAFGKVDAHGYNVLGFDENKIKISSFPYFEKFLPIKSVRKNKKYKKALILSPDTATHVLEKIGHEYNYYNGVVNVLDDLGIDVYGIKARHSIKFKQIGYETDYIELSNKKISLFSGYSSLQDILKSVDIVIGPLSTAFIETSLMGKDYYVFEHTRYYCTNHTNLFTLYKYINVSNSFSQLKNNINKKCVYNENYSVNDFVDLKGISSKYDLFDKFESEVVCILDKEGK